MVSEYSDEKLSKKEVVKDILSQLHNGMSPEEARDRLLKEVGSISSFEIADIEQSLISDGVSPEEIKKFCNVHALLFESSLEETLQSPDNPSHPVNLFIAENKGINGVLDTIKESVKGISGREFSDFKNDFKKNLEELNGVKIHYKRKEESLFPYLEKHGFAGPSKVMWGKDDEIRAMLKTCLSKIGGIDNSEKFGIYRTECLNPLLEEIEGMISKEEHILFPAALEKFSTDEWKVVLEDGSEIGYVYIDVPEEVGLLKMSQRDVVEKTGDLMSFPTGNLHFKELLNILNTLPVDITFVDKDDEVKYFSDSAERVFPRTKSVLGRKVQNCHPPKSIHVVDEIVQSFKDGSRDSVAFWINMNEMLVHIRYFAVRDENQNFLGTLEVTQDVTGIKNLKGEKRLLDEE